MSDQEITKASRRFVESCCDREHSARINEFADLLGIDRRRVGETTQRVTRLWAVCHVRHLRIESAKRLIAVRLPLKKVAYRAGFATRPAIFRILKQITGRTPPDYRSSKERA